MSMYKEVSNYLEKNFFIEAYGIFYYTPKLKKESFETASETLELAIKQLNYIKGMSNKRYKGTYSSYQEISY
jgi:hypothetical protein